MMSGNRAQFTLLLSGNIWSKPKADNKQEAMERTAEKEQKDIQSNK